MASSSKWLFLAGFPTYTLQGFVVSSTQVTFSALPMPPDLVILIIFVKE